MSIAVLEAEILGAPQVGAHRRRGSPSPRRARSWAGAGRTSSARIARRARPVQWPPAAGPPPTTSAARAAGGVLRLRPIMTAPSMRTIEIPGRSPIASAPSAVAAAEPTGASTRHEVGRAAGRDARPTSRPWTRAVLPVAIATATSGRDAAERGQVGHHPQDPERDDAGARRRVVADDHPVEAADARAAVRTAWIAARPLPQWTTSIAMSVATTRSMSRVGHRRRAAVDVAHDVRPRLEDGVRGDRARARRSTARRCGT